MKRFTLLLAVHAVACWALSAEARIWTDSSGTHKIDAELIAVRDNRVILKTTDGREVAVPIDRLSAADQKHLRDQRGTTTEASGSPQSPAQVASLGVHVRKPIPKGTEPLEGMELAMFAGSFEGTSVDFLVTTDLRIVTFDEDASKVTQFVDNQGTNLLPKGRQPFGLLSGRVRPDGHAAIVQISVPGTPAANAVGLTVEGTLVLQCGEGEKTAESELIDLKAGGSLKVGQTIISVKKGDDDFGPMGGNMAGAGTSDSGTVVSLSGKGRGDMIKSIMFLTQDGGTVEVGDQWGMEDTDQYEKNYRLSQSLSKFKVKVVYFEHLQAVTVPLAATVGLGL